MFSSFCNGNNPEVIIHFSGQSVADAHLMCVVLTGAVAVGAYCCCRGGRWWIRIHWCCVIIVLWTASLNGTKITMATGPEACGHGHIGRLIASWVRMNVFQLISIMPAQLHVSHLVRQRQVMWVGIIEKEQWWCDWLCSQ